MHVGICEVKEDTRVFRVYSGRLEKDEVSFCKDHVPLPRPRGREVPDGNHHSAMFRLFNKLKINKMIFCVEKQPVIVIPLHFRFYYLLA